ncbi:MAG: catechol 2,3-dioxygenase-like lactoylglutathione lyase family enzyme, partial [Verrucomicrobiales bacterium]
MKYTPILLGLLAMNALGAPRISEFMADNLAAYEDDQEAYSDWIEIYNPDADTASMGGWYLTDDPGDLQKWVFPTRAKVPADGYLVVHASGLNLAGLFDNTFHTNFSLRSGGEYLALVDPDGNVVQDFTESYPDQYLDVSYGTDGESDGYFSKSTPGEANSEFTEPPVKKVDFSTDGKTFFETSELELTHEDPDVEIRYTLDGSEPTLSLFKPAILYTSSITIDSTTTVRARAFKDGALPGRVKSEVFIQLGDDMKDFDTSLGLAFIDSYGTNVDSKGKDQLYSATAVFIEQDKATGLAKADGESDWSGRIGMRRRGQSSLDFAK